MADKPILFSGPMVCALLAGTKTQTRRGNHLERLRRFGPITEFGRSDTSGYDWHFRDKGMRWHDLRHGELLKYLPWQTGDRLYVRETWTHTGTGVWQIADVWNARDGRVAYQADDPIPGAKYWPSIHMPRSFSRLTLTVADVRVERLEDISEADALAEGVERLHHGFYPYGIATFMTVFVDGKEVPAQCCTSAHDSYMMLWNSINGRGAWQANPWVAAYTFSVELGNIDQLRAVA